MKMVQKLSLIAMAITLAACNEKVSPELQQGAAVDTPTDGGPTIVPTEYYFRLKNTSPLILNYRLHKTGANNFDKACEIKGPTKLSNENYQASTAYDISCFLEAEELSLFYGGLSFQLESSANTCEYLAYSPFSYFNIQPGSSYGTYLKIQKANDDVLQSHINTVATAKGINTDYTPRGSVVPSRVGADNYISETISTAARQPFSTEGIESDEVLCRFNYEKVTNKEGAPNCDEGQVTLRTLLVNYDKARADALWDQTYTEYTDDYTDTSDDDGGGPDDGLATVSAAENAARMSAANNARDSVAPTGTVSTRIIKCQGKAANCVDGPIKKHSQTSQRTIIYTQTEFDKAAATEKYEYPSLFPGKPTYKYANFRRDLANPAIDYGSTNLSAASYTGAFASATNGRNYVPNLIERYAANKNWDNSTMISPGLLTTYSTQYDQFTSTPLAAEPFVGVGGKSVNPFYTFYCLNAAYDIKARIRMVVRDWDRLSTNDSSLEWISDVGTINSRQDVLPTDIEDPESNDPLNYFNDKADWDDLLVMERLPGSPLIFRPEPVSYTPFGPAYEYGYPDGYFNPDNFPNWYDSDAEE